MKILGMMSGTSADGIDAAILEIYGVIPQIEWKVLFHHHIPYPDILREEIFACFRPETSTVDRICRLNFTLGAAYGEAALETIRLAGLTPNEIQLIGNHGQTLWHIPANLPGASTLQIGEPAVIAEMTGLPVVSAFRTADMAAGGHGAPLVSFADVCLFTSAEKFRAAQNIGGIGNVTWIPKTSDSVHPPIAFDTGPGNMLMDDAIERITNGQQHFDRDGEKAAQGKVHSAFLAKLLEHPYLQMRPPKTTGREDFGKQYGALLFEEKNKLNLSDADYLSTLTALTVQSIARASREFLPVFPDEVIVHGGGALNPVLMRMLREALAPAQIFTTDRFGLPTEAKEAAAFALMAYQTWHHQSGNIPSATGARHPVIMGNITPAPLRPGRIDENAGVTEAQNPNTTHIDELSTMALVQTINEEDKKVQSAVADVLPQLVQAVDAITARMRKGGRLIYFGAGTSGRLGILDASEILPTFGVSPDVVTGRIAGGYDALLHAVEGAEDNTDLGAEEMRRLNVGPNDSIVGIAASGNTPYVLGGLEAARQCGALTIGLACNPQGKIIDYAEIAILPVPGPEVISGSTRMKAGTAQKMVLNILSTAVMIRQGKVFGNLMVDVIPSNSKLIARQRKITAKACGISEDTATALLARCNGETKTAIVCHLANVTPENARARLAAADGFIRRALQA